MKIRTLVITAIALSVLTVTALYLKTLSRGTSQVDDLVGTQVIASDLIEQTYQITLAKDASEAVLTRTEDGDWILSSLFDLPVEIPKLQSLIATFTEAKINRRVSRNQETLKRLDLNQGTLTLLDDSGKKLTSLTLGKTLNNQSTSFIFNNDKTAYSMSAIPSLDTSSIYWANKTLYSIAPESVAGIQFIVTDSTWAIRRDESDKPWMSTTPNDERTPLEQAINSLLNKLKTQNFTAVITKENAASSEAWKNAQSNSRSIKLTLFTGETLTLTLSQSETEANKTYFSITSSNLSDPINQRMAKQVFETSAYSFNSLPTDLSSVSELPLPTPEPETPPEEILVNMEEIPKGAPTSEESIVEDELPES